MEIFPTARDIVDAVTEKQPHTILAGVVRRPLACVCAAFSGAVLLGVLVLSGWQLLLGGGLLLFCGLALCLRHHKLLGAALIAATAGLLLCWFWQGRTGLLERNWPGRIEPLTMIAADYPQPTNFGNWVEAQIQTEGELQGVRILLYVSDTDFSATPGDELSAYVRLRSARGDASPWILYNYTNGIFLQGSANHVTVAARPTPWYLLPRVWAYEIGQSFYRLFPEEEAGFLYALTTGNTSGLSEVVKDALKETGLRHIVAASGLHVNVLLTVLFLLPGSRKRKGLLFLPALAAFAALAGFTPSICRAAIMEAVLLIGPVLEREEDGLTSLSLALTLIVVGNPYAIASVSLQLSFAAMLGLLTVSPSLRQGRRSKIVRSLVTTLGANVFALPLALYYFGSVSLLVPLSNLVVLWVIPFLMPAALVCALLGLWIPWAAQILALPVGFLTKWIISGILVLARLPHVTLSGSNPLIIAWLLLAYLVGGLIYGKQLRGRAVPVFSALLLLSLAFCFWTPEDTIRAGEVQIALLDVGQGQSILLATEEYTVVIDCGSEQKRADGALKQALSDLHRDTIDLVILTHYDSDHINGLDKVMEIYAVGQLLAPQPTEEHTDTAEALWMLAEERGTTVTVLEGDTQIDSDALTLSVTPIGTDRNSGLAILVSAGSFDFLVTGDAGLEAETELIEHWALPQVEVLVAGHHGSKYATGSELLEAVSPETVLISVGSNSYGHPTEEMLARCEAAGADLWRTDENGTLTIRVRGSGN